MDGIELEKARRLREGIAGISVAKNDDEVIDMIRFEKEALTGKCFIFKTRERLGQRVMFEDMTYNNGKKYIHLQDGTEIDSDILADYGEFVDSVTSSFNPENQQTAQQNINDPLGYGGIEREPEDPVSIILKKAKITPTEIQVNLNVKIPPDALQTLLSSMYDDAEEKILEHTIKNVDHGDLMSQVRDAIKKILIKIE